MAAFLSSLFFVEQMVSDINDLKILTIWFISIKFYFYFLIIMSSVQKYISFLIYFCPVHIRYHLIHQKVYIFFLISIKFKSIFRILVNSFNYSILFQNDHIFLKFFFGLFERV